MQFEARTSAALTYTLKVEGISSTNAGLRKDCSGPTLSLVGAWGSPEEERSGTSPRGFGEEASFSPLNNPQSEQHECWNYWKEKNW